MTSSWDVFWFLFLFLPLAILWVVLLVDIMGRRDLVGWQKAIWVMALIFFPWIGVFAYLIARPREAALPAYSGVSAGQASMPPGPVQSSPTGRPTQYPTSPTQYPSDSRAATS